MYYAGQQPTVTSSGLAPYPHSQPALLQPGPAAQYPPPQYSQHYNYPTALTSPSAPSNPMAQAQTVLPLPAQPAMPSQYPSLDTTGQVAPQGMKPRVTATLWEDEGSLCFQVEARGICVARREDNHMINGTKLLNVAGMTRGRRDGILKSEKTRHVVKIGPMHLKGVWIPFERALEFANKEKITEMLYPLFVHNIGALLYHPQNQNRNNQVLQAAQRRREDSQLKNGQAATPGLPAIQHQMALPPTQALLPSHSTPGRPSLDRANTFPTPPTSASSVMGGMGAPDYQWSQPMSGPPQPANALAIDTGLTNRSLPVSPPSSSPPGQTVPSMQTYPAAGNHSYDASRPLYSAPPAHPSAYPPSSAADRSLYGAQSTYAPKQELGPAPDRPLAQDNDSAHHESKPHVGDGGVAHHHHHPEEEGEHEHEAEYKYDSNGYDSKYTYNSTAVPTLTSEHHLPSELSGSPTHQAGSGRATPRTATAPSPYGYQQNSGYGAPVRGHQQPQPAGSLYGVMDRNPATNGAGPTEPAYPSSVELQSAPLTNGGYTQPPLLNGNSNGSLKRGRDDDDDSSRPASDGNDMKRRKTMIENPVAAASPYELNRPASAVSQRRR